MSTTGTITIAQVPAKVHGNRRQAMLQLHEWSTIFIVYIGAAYIKALTVIKSLETTIDNTTTPKQSTTYHSACFMGCNVLYIQMSVPLGTMGQLEACHPASRAHTTTTKARLARPDVCHAQPMKSQSEPGVQASPIASVSAWDGMLMYQWHFFLKHRTISPSHWVTETKWPPFCRRPLQIHFLEWTSSYLDSNFTEICWQCLNEQQPIIGSDNGLTTNWRVIIWSNDGLVNWRIYVPFSLCELWCQCSLKYPC